MDYKTLSPSWREKSTEIVNNKKEKKFLLLPKFFWQQAGDEGNNSFIVLVHFDRGRQIKRR